MIFKLIILFINSLGKTSNFYYLEKCKIFKIFFIMEYGFNILRKKDNALYKNVFLFEKILIKAKVPLIEIKSSMFFNFDNPVLLCQISFREKFNNDL